MSSTPRKRIDCRQHASDNNCTLSIEGTEDEVLDAAMQHAMISHGHTETPDLREKLRALLTDVKTESAAG
jgi:predicted small metal-binding protein